MSTALKRIEACIPALRRYAFALLRDNRDADDLVQDCLVRAIASPPVRRPDADVRPWLFTVMHNLWVSQRRKAVVRGHPETLDRAEMLGAVAAAPTQHIEAEMRDLVRGLDSLAEEQRTVILLVCVEGMSYAEVARVLGVPAGTVMSRLSRGRERLRELMEGEACGERPKCPMLRRVK